MNNTFLSNKEHLNSLNPSRTIFYKGVISRNDDPLQSGRCQVRILGIHTADETKVPNEHLPWAELLVPVSIAGGNSGIGLSAIPIPGTWVWVYLEGGDWNQPVIFGIVQGQNNIKRSSPDGFRDDSDIYPIDDRLNETDQNRVARNKDLDLTIIKTIRDKNRDKNIFSNKGFSWSEMKEKNSLTKYPFNTVIETIGGSIIEYDSTKGNERITSLHKSGTYNEIQDNGDLQQKVVGEKKDIVNKNAYILIKGKKYEVIYDDVDMKYDSNINTVINGKSETTVKGATKENYNSGLNTDGGPKIVIKAGMIYLN